MTYLVEIKETTESKPLLEHLRSLKYVKVRKQKDKPATPYRFTDEEMALPAGKKPGKEEFEAWLTRPDKDKGASAETVRKRLVKKLLKNSPASK
jgi:hypothetical protein